MYLFTQITRNLFTLPEY